MEKKMNDKEKREIILNLLDHLNKLIKNEADLCQFDIINDYEKIEAKFELIHKNNKQEENEIKNN